ncbi:anthranilate synthase component I family protein [Dinghuibacter silviterrae]|uniref:Para-aminobenzoate synthetase component 1 n=1 Tax=Dinghuibacter silviterrae TaxID=1539049 RepID=A0A4R8DQJ6_9BACT|nr:anthranilate synthase component I family protein [Dinghuibacter silviterrae]TDX00209.1 para-aminobenzoate synthetase component 1 [Dinghuibacter silviterrae]
MTSKRTFTTFPVEDILTCKQQLLSWVNRFSSCCFLDNHGYAMPGGRLECLAGAGEMASISVGAGGAFSALEVFHRYHKDWVFGHLGYDLKNETEQRTSGLPDSLGFPDLRFFVPRYVFLLSAEGLQIGVLPGESPEAIWAAICAEPVAPPQAAASPRAVPAGTRPLPLAAAAAPPLQARFTHDDYLDTVHHLQRHIARGDCYEVTFCQEFFMEGVDIEPLQTFQALDALSPQPHAAYYKLGDRFLLCASPERYLQNEKGHLLSQPIKGTAARAPEDPEKDQALRDALLASPKEKSENVMIVDLVRNDLSRVCAEGSVRVNELWGIYAFPQVFQMISSIEGDLAKDRIWVDALKATFPMGSMTGAPKRRVLELIEQYERTKRGLYSGAIGYIDPEGNFDFAVVIRSLLYNRAGKYLSFSVGSAITAAADPEAEYQECLLKAGAIKKTLESVLSSASA